MLPTFTHHTPHFTTVNPSIGLFNAELRVFPQLMHSGRRWGEFPMNPRARADVSPNKNDSAVTELQHLGLRQPSPQEAGEDFQTLDLSGFLDNSG
jgi:hypothetical protein